MPAVKHNDTFLSKFLSSKTMQVFFILFALICVFLFYTITSTEDDFINQSRAAYEADRKIMSKNQGKPSDQFNRLHERSEVNGYAKNQAMKHAKEYSKDFHVLFLFTKAEENPKLKKKFNIAFESLFDHAKFESDEVLHIHFICDDKSRLFVEDFLQKHIDHPEFTLKVHFHRSSTVVEQLHLELQALQTLLGQNHPYYDDSIFFLSLMVHKILPENVHLLVQLDLDLKFTVNIRDIWNEFSFFARTNIIGLAYENQPVYRHILWKYRQDNPGTKLGSAPPNGKPGFNSGVILLHLDHMRASNTYKSYLEPSMIKKLVEKYSFSGHLGDQDFFTLLSFEYPELFFTLSCGWNRQLCQWWKNKGYEQVFDEYFVCTEDIKIWHGNCDTVIPT